MEKERRDESDKELEHSRNQIEQLESEYEDLQKQFVEVDDGFFFEALLIFYFRHLLA